MIISLQRLGLGLGFLSWSPLCLMPINGTVRAQSCQPGWDGALGFNVETGERVRTIGVYDDGTGPALYVGGGLNETAQGTGGIAKWTGSAWTQLGLGLALGSSVRAMVMFEQNLFVGGSISERNGPFPRYVGNIITWDGENWLQIPGFSGAVYALAVYDDGNGEQVYAGGKFGSVAAGIQSGGIARWTGSSWEPVGVGTGGRIYALKVFDDGSGPALYAAGTFAFFGDVVLNNIAKWDGTSWSPLGRGIPYQYAQVHALAVFDDGTGPALYAGGFYFPSPGCGVMRWDGHEWSLSGIIGYADRCPGTNANPGVHDLAVFDDGNGYALYAAGNFAHAGGQRVDGIAKWDGLVWSDLEGGVRGARATVPYALGVFDDGQGPDLYMGGNFEFAGTVPAVDVAVWTGCAAPGCLNTTPTACDDGVDCTYDSCHPILNVCEHHPSPTFCDDGFFCNGAETCDAELDCQTATPPSCDDDVNCTSDFCNPILDACDHSPSSAFCDDAVFCNGAETCDAALDCQPGLPPTCDDGVDCTIDFCSVDSDECGHELDDTLCDDELFCNGTEFCDGILGCQPGLLPDCDDRVACTIDSCDEFKNFCSHEADDTACDDSQFCNGIETCDPAGGCASNPPPCPSTRCDETQDTCREVEVPGVSHWGLVVLALLLMTAKRMRFDRYTSA